MLKEQGGGDEEHGGSCEVEQCGLEITGGTFLGMPKSQRLSQ